ncbi:MAG: hypothetical protein EAY66_00975 [Sphingobacteriales bacterium]|jgi:hypothetical protein|nr:MAG: hypothetical protein EAY66_00975 [Sphingobacteriales bacterium]
MYSKNCSLFWFDYVLLFFCKSIYNIAISVAKFYKGVFFYLFRNILIYTKKDVALVKWEFNSIFCLKKPYAILFDEITAFYYVKLASFTFLE